MYILLLINIFSFNSHIVTIEDLNECLNLLLTKQELTEKMCFYCDFCEGEEKVGVIANQLIKGDNLPIDYPLELSLSTNKGCSLRNNLGCHHTIYLPVYLKFDSIITREKNRIEVFFRLTNDHFIEKSKRKGATGHDFEYYTGKAVFLNKKKWKIESLVFNEKFIRGDFCHKDYIDYIFYNKLMIHMKGESYRELLQKHDSLLFVGDLIDYRNLNIKLDSLLKHKIEIIPEDFY